MIFFPLNAIIHSRKVVTIISNQEKQEFLTALGNRIRQLRIKKQMSLDELARKCGYTSDNARSSMQKIEAGRTDIPASKIGLIAKALEVSISIIMGWHDEQDSSYNTQQSQLESQFHSPFENLTNEVVSLYTQLDMEDRAEIRGEIKQMLRAEKYKKE